MNQIILYRRWIISMFCLLLLAGTGIPVYGKENTGSWILEGRVRYLHLQGGCWAVENDRGQRFELVGEEDKLSRIRLDGMKVRLLVQSETGRMSYCMIGPMVRVIRVLETG
ncbi:hypothetical protein GXN76_06535 [Kroppenstedtia pulmonis]|uniref:Uncharacterized protein n=1 Tax=Kroppenstedtia pulmonis TaxID=1380685 RepID=A0A7D3XI26_9BACL|nr:hypothetical protein [Kroppenstedtia pulmonis]QKG84164.1 hypothetical protein GXN76_06535 [Kroppenstedtia pulmonis]